MTLPQTLDSWLEYISRQHSAEIVMGLERVRTVWERMGRPQAPINLTVGGTNGKGSTCAMTEAILHAAGYRTGFYTSPHLLRYNERVRLGRTEAGDELLVASFAAVEAARQSPEPISLTYFEFGTLSALWIFARENVEVGILEVGLGGRLDAVNIVDADAAVVVSVDLDHMNFLGDTREKIGWEKAHIFRPGRAAVCADAHPPQSLLDHAQAIGAQLLMLNRDYRYRRMEQQWQLTGKIGGREFSRSALPLPALRGGFQLQNAAAALVALAALAERLPVSLGHIKRGLVEVEWSGRMQVLPGRPAIVLDVAHNPHAVRALHDALGTMGYFENTYAVFGMMKDKDIDAVIGVIRDRIDHWFVSGLAIERGASAARLAENLSAAGLQANFTLHASVAQAFAAARERAGQNDRILVFGSFHTVADVLHALKPA